MIGMLLGWLSSHWLIIAIVVVALAAIANPVLVWKLKAWILLAVVLWWGWTGHAAYDALLDKNNRDAAEASVEIEAANFAASEAARHEERARTEAIAFADQVYQEGLRDGKAAADHVLAGVADGTYVLRDHFRCPAQRGAGAVAPGAAGGDGAQGAVLSPADVQFLVRFAGEADDAVRQLAAAQAVIQADRSKTP